MGESLFCPTFKMSHAALAALALAVGSALSSSVDVDGEAKRGEPTNKRQGDDALDPGQSREGIHKTKNKRLSTVAPSQIKTSDQSLQSSPTNKRCRFPGGTAARQASHSFVSSLVAGAYFSPRESERALRIGRSSFPPNVNDVPCRCEAPTLALASGWALSSWAVESQQTPSGGQTCERNHPQ